MSDSKKTDNPNNDNETFEAADDDDHQEQDGTVSLGEVLQETEYWEETATAVLGGSDQQQCSYDQGYVKRQALYACLTCNPPDSSNYVDAGVCLACSIKCHRDHDLVELYTKRNFRCDCGNKKFLSSGCQCQLQPIKSDYNMENKYDHNFKGLYCICDRPYPDTDEDEDDSNEDEMIQCVICEDWLHGRHSENDYVDLDDELAGTGDFVCKACTAKCDFLVHYGDFLLKGTPASILASPDDISSPPTAAAPEEKHCIDVVDGCGTTPSVEIDGSKVTSNGHGSVTDLNGTSGEDLVLGTVTSEATPPAPHSIESENPPMDKEDENVKSVNDKHEPLPSAVSASCFLESTATEDSSLFSGGTWWKKDWRNSLCKCEKCLVTYESLGVKFLVDPEDPLEVYEARGRANSLTNGTANELDSLFNEMDRVKQIEVIHAVNEMKEGILEMVGRANADGRPVSREDVQVLFEALRNKRRRLDVYIPDSCR